MPQEIETIVTLAIEQWIKEYNEAPTTSGTLVLRQNSDSNLPGCNADDEGENDRGLTATDIKT